MEDIITLAQIYGQNFALLQTLRHSNMANGTMLMADVSQATAHWKERLVAAIAKANQDAYAAGQASVT